MAFRRPLPTEESDDAAVIGVVVAGVLASFVVPGPFDFGSLVIGLLLLSVLFAYGRWPTSRDDWRKAVGMAAAMAFCFMFTVSALLDQAIVGSGEDRVHLWSRWSAALDDSGELPTREAGDHPSGGDGVRLLGTWLLFYAIAYAQWWRRATPKTGIEVGSRAAPPR